MRNDIKIMIGAILNSSADIDIDKSLDSYGLDSLGIVELIDSIEREYLIEFEIDDLNIDNFETIRKIEKIIGSKLRGEK